MGEGRVEERVVGRGERRGRRQGEEAGQEIRALRARLWQLEAAVGGREEAREGRREAVVDRETRGEREELDGGDGRVGRGNRRDGGREGREARERSLALLTAQYEKAGGEELEDELNMSLASHTSHTPHHPVPPPMELNNSARVGESVRLARQLRSRREQLERLVQKNVFPSACNELGASSPEAGRRRGAGPTQGEGGKETNMAGSAGQQLGRLQQQVSGRRPCPCQGLQGFMQFC